MPISRFVGKYRFLSNFYMASVEIDGFRYPSSEHAFQAMKCTTDDERSIIANLSTPLDAKRRGRLVLLPPDWEYQKIGIMLRIVYEKFKQNPILKDKLLNTNDEFLIEGNTWDDTFWGANLKTNLGTNMLGIILMALLEDL